MVQKGPRLLGNGTKSTRRASGNCSALLNWLRHYVPPLTVISWPKWMLIRVVPFAPLRKNQNPNLSARQHRNCMNRHDASPSQSETDARTRREARESKPVREWTAEERCEAFREARTIERERAEAGIVEEWELCETCHDYKHEPGLLWCRHCIEEMRQYED